jgi:hypothetical protein
MEWYLGPEGDQRIWYEQDEIEDLMSEQLRGARQRLTLANPIPDIEAFVENHLRVDLDQYATLPSEVLGLTEFDQAAAPKMKINAELTDAADADPPRAGMRGRWRATIAHEAAHVLLHRYLFDPDMSRIRQGEYRDPLAADTSVTADVLKRVECLHRDVDSSRSTPSRVARDWREIQANRGMSALLMPSGIFKRVALMNGAGVGFAPETDSPKGLELAEAMAGAFDVSRQAATLRLRALQLLV